MSHFHTGDIFVQLSGFITISLTLFFYNCLYSIVFFASEHKDVLTDGKRTQIDINCGFVHFLVHQHLAVHVVNCKFIAAGLVGSYGQLSCCGVWRDGELQSADIIDAYCRVERENGFEYRVLCDGDDTRRILIAVSPAVKHVGFCWNGCQRGLLALIVHARAFYCTPLLVGACSYNIILRQFGEVGNKGGVASEVYCEGVIGYAVIRGCTPMRESIPVLGGHCGDGMVSAAGVAAVTGNGAHRGIGRRDLKRERLFTDILKDGDKGGVADEVNRKGIGCNNC